MLVLGALGSFLEPFYGSLARLQDRARDLCVRGPVLGQAGGHAGILPPRDPLLRSERTQGFAAGPV